LVNNELDKNLLEIEKTEETMEKWLNKAYISDELRENLGNVDILIIPSERFKKPGFPFDTVSLFDFFKKELPENLKIGICIEDKEYAEFQYNAEIEHIGYFIVKELAIPFFIAIITAYIIKKFIEKKKKPEINLTFVKDKKGEKITFKGSADDFRRVSEDLKNYKGKKDET